MFTDNPLSKYEEQYMSPEEIKEREENKKLYLQELEKKERKQKRDEQGHEEEDVNI
jgi:hypothetical protein